MSSFDIATITDKHPALKKLSAALAKATGQTVPVVNIEAKPKRTAGVSTRSVELVLSGNQKVMFMFRQGGDVWRVKINGKDTPLTGDVTLSDEKFQKQSFDVAINQIAQAVTTGQKAFENKLNKEKVAIPPKTKNSTTPKNVSQQLQAANQKVDELNQVITQRVQTRDSLSQQLAQLQQQAGV
ncbi:MAG: hypothetical protein RLY58_1952 [Pseudomonadota bacterium]|jgi:hypothetical protein